MKTCFKCLVELPLSEFYAHPQMGDGHLGKCKSCTKRDVTQNRNDRIEQVRAYDRDRAKLPHRRAGVAVRTELWRKADKRRDRCHNAATRKHRKAPEACQMCGLTGKRLERHHPDYDLPLMIMWLCKPCHYLADKSRRDKEAVKV